MSSELSREFLKERDARIYAMRATGVSPTDIAKRVDVSVGTVHNAISRHLRTLNSGNFSLVEVVIMELDRLDKVQSAIFPLTQYRNVKMDDGTMLTVEPDLRAIDSLLKVMQHRAKLLGLDVQRTMDITASTAIEVTSSLKGQEALEADNAATTQEEETRQLLTLAVEAGIFDADVAAALLNPVQEAEIVDEGDTDE